MGPITRTALHKKIPEYTNGKLSVGRKGIKTLLDEMVKDKSLSVKNEKNKELYCVEQQVSAPEPKKTAEKVAKKETKKVPKQTQSKKAEEEQTSFDMEFDYRGAVDRLTSLMEKGQETIAIREVRGLLIMLLDTLEIKDKELKAYKQAPQELEAEVEQWRKLGSDVVRDFTSLLGKSNT